VELAISSTVLSMKKRVVIILNRLVIGGQAVDTIPLAYYLQKHFDILILYGDKEKDEVEALFLLQQYSGLYTKKVKYLKRTINPLIDIAAFFSILVAIKKYKAHVVHTHGSKSGVLGRLAAKVLSIPVIVHTFHGHLFHSYFNSIGNTLVKWVEQKLALISTAIIALSNEQKHELTDVFHITGSQKVKIVPLGVDEKLLQPISNNCRQYFREQKRIPADALVIGSVGRIVPIKNLVLFLQVAQALLAKGYNELYFVVVGDGESKQQLLDFLRANNILYSDKENNNKDARIIFTSWVEDMATAYYGLDIVMLTSLNEGTPLSIIEAQFCGKPVIASNVGGVKDTFLPDISGLLVQGNNVDDFVLATEKLLEDALLRKQMSDAAIVFANNTFSKAKEVAAMKEVYLELLSNTI
jgi:glycosyltransferase involved in cell wall biosynthesis